MLAAAVLVLAAGCKKPLEGPVPGTDEPGTEEPGDEPGTDPTPQVKATYQLYGAVEMEITTDGNAPVDSKKSKDARPCTIKIDGSLLTEGGEELDCSYEGRASIRGRGNSTWLWYPKKPYRFKLEESAELLGMKSEKDWVLLADYRDVTHMMNNIGFTMAEYLGIPYTNHTRYVKLTLNGKYLGVYVLSEQVEEGKNRVKVGEDGMLLALDVDDGPSQSPDAADNFYSAIYGTDVCVKYPKDPTAEQLAAVKEEFAVLESAIKSKDWQAINMVLDVESMISYLILEEAVYNVEMDNGISIRSGYINKTAEGRWTMGPAWDFDAGFCYDWSDMYDRNGQGHSYFSSYKSLIYGSNPYTGKGAYGAGIPKLFSDLWGVPEFVKAYKEKWNENKDGLLEAVLANIDAVNEAIGNDLKEDSVLWGISKNYDTASEISRLKTWLVNRFSYIDGIIAIYPMP